MVPAGLELAGGEEVAGAELVAGAEVVAGADVVGGLDVVAGGAVVEGVDAHPEIINAPTNTIASRIKSNRFIFSS